jgi:hypothetical protein
MPRTESKYNFGSPKEDYNAYMRQYSKMEITCDCGCKVKRGGMNIHKKSEKHKLKMSYIKSIQDLNNLSNTIKKIQLPVST